MSKYDGYIIQKIQFLRLHYYLLLWSILRIYYTTLKMFKIFDSTTVNSKDDEDEMDYLSLKALAVKLIGSFLVKQQIINISLDYIMGLNQKPWHMLNLEYFCSFCSHSHVYRNTAFTPKLKLSKKWCRLPLIYR